MEGNRRSPLNNDKVVALSPQSTTTHHPVMRTYRWFIWAGVAAVVLFLAANYQSFFKAVLPPEPVIVSMTADDSSSGLFDYSARVLTEVRNSGGDGYVVVEATVRQKDDRWTKTQQVYMPLFATQKFELVFDEVRLFGKDPDCSVRAFALGH